VEELSKENVRALADVGPALPVFGAGVELPGLVAVGLKAPTRLLEVFRGSLKGADQVCIPEVSLTQRNVTPHPITEPSP
jgi:hypothetical protein